MSDSKRHGYTSLEYYCHKCSLSTIVSKKFKQVNTAKCRKCGSNYLELLDYVDEKN